MATELCKVEYLLKFIQNGQMELPKNLRDSIFHTFRKVMNDDLQGLYDGLTASGKELFKDFQKSSFSIELPSGCGMDEVYIKGFFEGMRGYWVFLSIIDAEGLLDEPRAKRRAGNE